MSISRFFNKNKSVGPAIFACLFFGACGKHGEGCATGRAEEVEAEPPQRHIEVILTDAHKDPSSYISVYYMRDLAANFCTQVTLNNGAAVVVIDCALLGPR